MPGPFRGRPVTREPGGGERATKIRNELGSYDDAISSRSEAGTYLESVSLTGFELERGKRREEQDVARGGDKRLILLRSA